MRAIVISSSHTVPESLGSSSMAKISSPDLLAFARAIFEAAGLPTDQAYTLSGHLVESNLVGHDSHGVIRIPQYVNLLQSGNVRPFGDHEIVRETAASQVVNANGSLGIPMAHYAMKWAVDRARERTFGAVAVHRSGHIGRLGAYPPVAAREDCIGLILLNGIGCFAAPFGGTARRLPPNPISISVPTEEGAPLMLDMTTSMVAGGKVSLYNAIQKPVPSDWLIGSDGKPVTDSNLFFEDKAAMLPLGGSVGYKGYGLAVMIDAIAGGLSWAGCSCEEPTRGGSGFLALAIDIASFIDVPEFKREITRLSEWLKSSPKIPGVERIYLPGEIEETCRKAREVGGIEIDDVTWGRIVETGTELKIAAPSAA